MKITIGSDHTGVFYKKIIKLFLIEKGYKIKDHGTHSNESVDYPDFIHPTAKYVENKYADFGIIICGSGNGAAITANKYQTIRAALIWNEKTAILAKEHNNANIISIPSYFVNETLLLNMIKIFLDREFKEGRHKMRINKIPIVNHIK